MKSHLLRLVTGAIATALILVPSGAGAMPDPERRSFTAYGYPYPQIFSGGCKTGVEGFSYSSLVFKPPTDGALEVSMVGFEGNWDLTIYDAATGGELVNAWEGGWAGAPPKEQVRLYLEKGRSVEITACNFLSTQFAVKVTYEFDRGASRV